MSHSNRAVIQDALDQFNQTGVVAWDPYTPDVVFKTRGDLEQSASFQGRDGLERALRGFAEVWAAMRFERIEQYGAKQAALPAAGLAG